MERVTYIALFLVLVFAVHQPSQIQGRTMIVATQSSSEKSKAAADFVGDGVGDQEEIYAAIHALPASGGTVTLMEGTYDIRKVKDKLGGLIIDRSNVTLIGRGAATRLILAPDQNTNVIRIIGNGVGNIVIRDLWVDQNRDQNPYNGAEFVNISHGRFEYNGIKAFCAEPGGSCPEPTHNITIENCTVLNAQRLGIMLDGPNMRVVNNRLGNAHSDAVELLEGPGFVMGNFVEITGRTHVAVGSDRGNSIIMANNVVHVREGGDLDIAFRSWADSERHVISNNIVMVDKGGKLGLAMDVRGFDTSITGNVIRGRGEAERLPLWLTGAGMAVTGNHFQNVELIVNDQTGTNRPILIQGNVMENSRVSHEVGNLIRSEGD
ncbi:MAG: right-handed parallel beta-helix repeat-containing protein [Gemmatimonadetes bacterium]|nr:right-handed parallel beta-helix repeat-containing protein [Gemmatimonadota bacterium]